MVPIYFSQLDVISQYVSYHFFWNEVEHFIIYLTTVFIYLKIIYNFAYLMIILVFHQF